MKSFLLSLLALTLTTHQCLSWGEPHRAITKGALDVLPVWQKEILGEELAALSSNHCLIPDSVYTDKENAKFATMDIHPGEVYLTRLHLPLAEQTENLETLRYFIGQAVTSLQAGKTGDAARFMGTICHLIEDFGSPSHTIPGDNQFTLLQQFMPASEIMAGKLLHGPIENGTFEVSIAAYEPRLFGITVEETSWRLLHRVHEVIIHARSVTFPIIQALNAGDATSVTAHQMKAAKMDAQVVADAMHTIICLGTERFDATAEEALQSVDISTHWPMEAVNLYYPQTQFFSSPYWGYPRSGVVLEGGTKSVPIRLQIQHEGALDEKQFATGISTGMGKPLTWHLPKEVYRRFTVHAGLQLGVGENGRIEFSILGDGKTLATATVNGSDPAYPFDCDITGVSLLQLAAVTRGLDPKSNYAVWAEPILQKGPSE